MERALNRPADLAGLSRQVFDVLARYTMFPWPVLKAQAERVRADPLRLTHADLDGPLLEHLAASVARFTSPAKGARAREELAALLVAPSRRTVRPQP
jgi:hypothetical protein